MKLWVEALKATCYNQLLLFLVYSQFKLPDVLYIAPLKLLQPELKAPIILGTDLSCFEVKDTPFKNRVSIFKSFRNNLKDLTKFLFKI